MSKLYKKYVLLKIQDSKKFYLFECGIFYIFIHNDAEIMAKLLDLKLTPLNSMISKCGFPVKSAERYFKILRESEYDIEIVSAEENTSEPLGDYVKQRKYEEIINDFLELNIDNLSISEAFDYLHYLQNQFKEIEDSDDD